MALKNKATNLATTNVELFECQATTEATVHGFFISNSDLSESDVVISLYDASEATTVEFLKFSVEGASAVSIPKTVNLEAGDKILARSPSGSAVSCLLSILVNNLTPASVTITPKGTWSNVTAYSTLDLVYYLGNSYIALTSSTDEDPTTNVVAWSTFAEKGAPGGLVGYQFDTEVFVNAPVKQVAVAISSANSNTSVNCNTTNYFTSTVTEDTTFTFDNVPDNVFRFSLKLYNAGSYDITWPTSIVWNGGFQPDFGVNKTDILDFLTYDTGTTWYGSLVFKEL